MLEGHGRDYILMVLFWRLKKKSSAIISYKLLYGIFGLQYINIKNRKLFLTLQNLFPGRLSLTFFTRLNFTNCIWVKVFKSGPRKICGSQPLKNLKCYSLLKSRPYYFKFFKGCLPQILLGPSLNTFTRMLGEGEKEKH